ncbi:hypothetical protein PM8797T_14801 [Gimesia maris DSM 8797]|nr:hypothetical protein PM8797T_14801 [Gimesia maris DSM 8797]
MNGPICTPSWRARTLLLKTSSEENAFKPACKRLNSRTDIQINSDNPGIQNKCYFRNRLTSGTTD